jgi:uncharacterized repeat protein (TIGR01451 family)
LTDDPFTLAIDDPTITAVTAAPVLLARKSEALWQDADLDGFPSPNDTLLYTVRLLNIGNSQATGVLFNDSPDGNTTLVFGSVQTSQGTVTTGNDPGDTAVVVDIGSISGGGSVVLISFQVTINDPLPGGVTQVANQGSISSNELPSFLTDDPDTPVPADPTITPVAATPILSAVKLDILYMDLNGDGQASPGDTLLYEIVIYNGGTTAATGVSLVDSPGLYTSLVVGSVATNRGTVTIGNTPGDSSLVVNVGELPARRMMRVAFEVIIDNPLPDGIEQVANQAVINSNELAPLLSDDPDTPDLDDITLTPINAAPDLVLEKTDGGNPAALEGTLVYTINYSNQGTQDAVGVLLEETVPDYTTFNAGLSDPAWNCAGTTPGSLCSLAIGALPVGGSGSTTFGLTIDNSVPAGTKEVRNIAVINDDGSNGPDLAYSTNISSDDTRLTTPTSIGLASQSIATPLVPTAVIWLLCLALVVLTLSKIGLRE